LQVSEPILSEPNQDELIIDLIKFTPCHKRLEKLLSEWESRDIVAALRAKSRTPSAFKIITGIFGS